MSLIQLWLKYNERQHAGYEYTPIGELLGDLQKAMNKRQYESFIKKYEKLKKGKEGL